MAEHESVKQFLINGVTNEQLEKWFGDNGELLKYKGGNWKTEADFVEMQSNTESYPLVSEFSRMEHRRLGYIKGVECYGVKQIKKM